MRRRSRYSGVGQRSVLQYAAQAQIHEDRRCRERAHSRHRGPAGHCAAGCRVPSDQQWADQSADTGNRPVGGHAFRVIRTGHLRPVVCCRSYRGRYPDQRLCCPTFGSQRFTAMADVYGQSPGDRQPHAQPCGRYRLSDAVAERQLPIGFSAYRNRGATD